jgi:hypothetical protein
MSCCFALVTAGEPLFTALNALLPEEHFTLPLVRFQIDDLPSAIFHPPLS